MFDVLKHVRLPLVATKLLEGYVNNCTDLSLKVRIYGFCTGLWSHLEGFMGFLAADSSSIYPNVLIVSCCLL